ncbi:amino acid/amide ABC transporter substrate-binding protein, HAAT family [Pseudoxanthobacter soli DSM 19599]|uniref:Amino acid/amide ABC transporter substrate-binding protein, HAAT family n=1 Tax=Pseudoxanthobacter soli DSM 19599 TaxID=1123029 RepID=A0A1M7Z6S1_9HYPH|nr:branched-chain amino acid ABC transporter substrate-binding protein [Pseudoxanthobacter soli]SHO60470.1 amino acid/amide ABC transporter substrate-binding protein, HAAT family [Pseudoxanthobacter soli DSM 19599]
MKKVLLAGAALAFSTILSSAAWADILIATEGPMTGQYASFGAQLKAGAEQAVADINAAGGVLGEKLVLEIGDDACDPKQAVAVANQLASKGVKFVAGAFCSGSSIPASAVYAEEGIIMISPASTNPKFTDERPGDMIFRVCGRDDQQGQVAGKFLADHFAGKKIAILNDKSAYGLGLAEETRKYYNEAGGKEVLWEAYTAGEKDYTALVSKMKQAGVQVVYIGGYHTEAGLILRQMREQGMDAVVVSGDALVTDEYWAITGKAGEGTLMTFSPDPRKNPEAAPIVEEFRKKGIEPEGYVLYTYAAIQAWADAVKAAGTTDLEPVVKALSSGDFKTVLGDLKFDSKGDVTMPGYVMYEWKDGKYDYFKS